MIVDFITTFRSKVGAVGVQDTYLHGLLAMVDVYKLTNAHVTLYDNNTQTGGGSSDKMIKIVAAGHMYHSDSFTTNQNTKFKLAIKIMTTKFMLEAVRQQVIDRRKRRNTARLIPLPIDKAKDKKLKKYLNFDAYLMDYIILQAKIFDLDELTGGVGFEFVTNSAIRMNRSVMPISFTSHNPFIAPQFSFVDKKESTNRARDQRLELVTA
ncbi:hypothetical protein M8C21_019699, partial [Ambrosia artemisiifolia]